MPSFFQLLGLPEQFDIDEAQLEQNYQQLMKNYHPDNFVSAPAVLKRSAMQMATNINTAYESLHSPLKRAQYWLTLRQIENASETVPLCADFLSEQIAWREKIAQADADALIAIAKALSTKLKAFEKKFSALTMSEEQLQEKAQACINEWQFFEKLAALLQEKGVLLS